jgi:ABC-type dipeptide/oligopeptide/nickel transport system permease subunit
VSAARRARAHLSVVVLMLFVLVAVFADLMAASGPLIARSHAGWIVAPDLRGRHWTPAERTALLSEGGFSIWAPIPFGSDTPCPEGPNAPPSAAHWLGTDAAAHDVLAVTIHGTRTIVVLTALSSLWAALIGFVLGAAAGHGPPFVDGLLARSIELTGAIPTVVLIALLRAGNLLPAGLAFLIVVTALRAVEIARLTRGEVLRVGGSDYVLAAHALGASGPAVLFRHVLPHVLGPLSVSVTLGAASIVGLEAALSFLGLGLAREAPSWGSLLGQIGSGARPLTLVVPAACVVTMTGCLYALADRLDDWASARRAGPTRN